MDNILKEDLVAKFGDIQCLDSVIAESRDEYGMAYTETGASLEPDSDWFDEEHEYNWRMQRCKENIEKYHSKQ